MLRNEKKKIKKMLNYLQINKKYLSLQSERKCNHYKNTKRGNMKTYEYLQSFGIKPSVQRMAIMDYLLTHKTHPSIDEIYMALCDDIPTLSKTTVYNTLKLFVENGAAQMLTIDERNVNYDGDISFHAHFLCKKCNRIFDLPAIQHEEHVAQFSMNGFAVQEIHQYYKGICPACAAKESLPKASEERD